MAYCRPRPAAPNPHRALRNSGAGIFPSHAAYQGASYSCGSGSPWSSSSSAPARCACWDPRIQDTPGPRPPWVSARQQAGNCGVKKPSRWHQQVSLRSFFCRFQRHICRSAGQRQEVAPQRLPCAPSPSWQGLHSSNARRQEKHRQ